MKKILVDGENVIDLSKYLTQSEFVEECGKRKVKISLQKLNYWIKTNKVDSIKIDNLGITLVSRLSLPNKPKKYKK
jgi:hypothetical protein